MTRIFNRPEDFIQDVIEGFCELHKGYVVKVPGGVVRATGSIEGKVSVLLGGGSGHYPAFYGIVGPGFADGAIVGNVFTSPSSQDAISIAKAAHNGGGVVITSGNYAGDVIHFTEAADQLTREGIPTQTVFVTDDMASAPVEQEDRRRGIAGGFAVFKILSAAAEAGYSLDEVVRVGKAANKRTRTLGLAFDGCTLPGEESPLFSVPKGKMAVGLGIHGEPGIAEEDIPRAREMAQRLVRDVASELDLKPGSRVAAILNGLGSTKMEELFVLWADISKSLGALKVEIIEPEVGEIVTSLDMAGLSLTLVNLDDELETFWRAASDTPAFKKNAVDTKKFASPARVIQESQNEASTKIAVASSVSKNCAFTILTLLEKIKGVLVSAQSELGRIDAVAGDGDHGRGMVKGITAAIEGANEVVRLGAGARQTLESAGNFWSGRAGGTSGALWGAALISMAAHYADDAQKIEKKEVVNSVVTALNTIMRIGKAELGDKTMIDSLHPFMEVLEKGINDGQDLASAWSLAAEAAKDAALETSSLSPKIGRARPLAEKSVGTPDAGATSMAMILESIGQQLTEIEEGKNRGGHF
jgi:dihydroxyacetone kinase